MTSLRLCGPDGLPRRLLAATIEASQNKHLDIFNYLVKRHKSYAFTLCGNVISSNMTNEHVCTMKIYIMP